MNSKRVAACGTLALTGVGIGVVSAGQIVAAGNGVVGTVIAAFGLLIGVGFLGGSVALHESDLRTNHALRVAGWNLTGVVVTSAVLALIAMYQQASGGLLTSPVFSGTVVVGVSATAHVLIGVNDVRRIRARNLAKQREKASVMNRLIRHDLKHSAQVLLGLGDALTGRESAEVADIGDRVSDVGADLADIDRQVETVTDLVETETVERRPITVADLAREVASAFRTDYPDASVSVAAADDVRALAGEPLEIALDELIENALEHSGDPASVDVRIERDDGTVTVTVADDGPGIPEAERSLITGEQEVTQLNHSDGLGLWLSKWVVEAYGGSIEFPEGDTDGGVVVIRLDAA